jgi:hypothetical protein
VFRQRIRTHVSATALTGNLLLTLIGLGLIWYGLMVVLLALKSSPNFVNDISGYRTAYSYFAGLEPSEITTRVRLIAGLAGLAAFVVFGFLAWKQIPRPYLARSELRLGDDERGTLIVEPRAVERAAEAAAREHPAVSEAAGRYEVDGVAINVHVRRGADLAGTLRDVDRRVREALDRHDLPTLPVNVTLTGFDRQHRRELN